MSKFLSLTLLSLLLVVSCSETTSQEKASSSSSIRIIAEEAGGGWYAYATTMSKISQDNNITLNVIPRGGSIANPSVVDRKEADLGFTTLNAASWAESGGSIYKGQTHTNIRGVLAGFSVGYELLLARRAYVEKTGNDSLEKMVGNNNPAKFITEPQGSQDPIIAEAMLYAVGTSVSNLRSQNRFIQVGSSQIAQQLRDGLVDAVFINAPINHPTTSEIDLTSDIVFVPLSENIISELENIGMPRVVLTNKAYSSLTQDYPTGGSISIIIANADTDEEVVYNFTKIMIENIEYLRKEHGALQSWDPEEGAKLMSGILDLHPGALKYYREVGWIE